MRANLRRHRRPSGRTCSWRSHTCAPETPSWCGGSTGWVDRSRTSFARAAEMRRGGVGLKSLKEAIDTDSPTGQVVFHIFGALAEFERALIRERPQAGLQAARGRLGGRRKRLDAQQWAHALQLYRERQHTVKEICSLMGISRATLYAYVEEFSKQA